MMVTFAGDQDALVGVLNRRSVRLTGYGMLINSCLMRSKAHQCVTIIWIPRIRICLRFLRCPEEHV